MSLEGAADAPTEAVEASLVDRLLRLQTAAAPLPAEKQQWYADAYAFLQAHGGQHWWCRHSDVTAGLAELLRYHEQQPLVQAIWGQLAAQLAACTDCANAHHAFQEALADQYAEETAAPLAVAMHELDCVRLAAALADTAAAAAADEDGGGGPLELPPQAIASLFEALCYDTLLEDAEVADALAAALCALSTRYELALAEPGSDARYPGAYRLLAHPDPQPRRLAAATVRAWGLFSDATAEAVLPTLQYWVQLLAGQPPGSFPAAPRPRFRPPPVALWRALHGLLPLLSPEAAVTALQQLESLAEVVLAGVGGGASPQQQQQQQEAELCRWFAIGCWQHLLQAAGPELFYHTASPPAAVVQQLAAAARGTASEQLHKAAAEAAAATLLHAAAGGGPDAVAALRHGLLFLLHDLPEASAAAAASPAGQQQQQGTQAQPQQQPRVSQLVVAVAEAAAFSALLKIFQKGGEAAAAAFDCAEFWLPPLCSTLLEGGDGAAPSRRRSPDLFAAADKAAWQLAAALLAAEAAALQAAAWGSAAAHAPQPDRAAEAVAAAAAERAGSWRCLPALWRAFSSSASDQRGSTLLLATAAALAASGGSSGRPGATAGLPAPAPAAERAGFAAPGLASSLASDIAAAQQLVPPQVLRSYCLRADPTAASPAAIPVSRGPAFLAEQLQQAAAEHLAALTERCRRGGASSARPWPVDPQRWQPRLAEALAALLAARNQLLRAAAEEFAMVVAQQGSAAAAAFVLAQLHPTAAPLLRPLMQKGRPDARLAGTGGSSNPFVRRQEQGAGEGGAAAAKPNGAARWPRLVPPRAAGPEGASTTAAAAAAGRTSGASAVKVEIIDLTDSPPVSAGLQAQQAQQAQRQKQQAQQAVIAGGQPAAQAGAQQAAQRGEDAPWFLHWPSKQQQQAPQAQQAQQAQRMQQQSVQQPEQRAKRTDQARQQSALSRQAAERQASLGNDVKQQTAAGNVDVDALWPSQWPSRTAPQQQQQPRQPAERGGGGLQHAAPPSTARQQKQTEQQPVPQQRKPPEPDVDALWPEKWPARRPAAGATAKQPKAAPDAAGNSGARDAAELRRTASSRRQSSSPEADPGRKQRQPAAQGVARGGATFVIPKRPGAAAAAAPTKPVALRQQVAAHGSSREPEPRQQPGRPASQQAQHAPPPARPLRGPGLGNREALQQGLAEMEEDESLFANLPPPPPTGQQRPGLARLPRPAAPPPPPRRIVHLSSPLAPPGRRGLAPAAAPLWQQRRAALGAARQQAAAAAALLSMDSLLQRLLAWEPAAVLRGGGEGLRGLTVPTRFDNLQQYTQVFSQLLLEELRAHLQQAAEESPPAAAICASSASSAGAAGWPEVAAALAAAAAAPLRLLEAQRQSDLHLLRFEPAGEGAAGAAAAAAAASGGRQRGGEAAAAADWSRGGGIRADDLLLLVSRPAAAAATPKGVGAASAPPALPPAAVALAAVESVHTALPSERRQQQGIPSRQRQTLLTMRVSLRSGGAPSGNRQLVQQQLSPGTAWQAVRLASLTPHLRQLQALVAAQKLPPLLLAELLSPRTAPPAGRTGDGGGGSRAEDQPQRLAEVQPPLPPPLLATLQRQFNASQQAAIAAAVGGFQTAAAPRGGPASVADGSTGVGWANSQPQQAQQAQQAQRQVVLVQGPPGTGKTAAILGMLSALLAPNSGSPGGTSDRTPAEPRGKQAAATAAAAGASPQPPRRAAVLNPQARVLLCAQSNAAVDELCSRLAGRGVVGRNGVRRQVAVVRFGPAEAVGADAAALHIDALAAAAAEQDARLDSGAGQSAELAERVQSLRQQLRELQQQIDACDEAAEAARSSRAQPPRKRRREERQPRGRREGERWRRRSGSDKGSSSSSDMEVSGVGSDSDVDIGGAAAPAAADRLPASQEARERLSPLLQRKQQLKREAAAAADALRASRSATAARKKELRAAVVAQCEVVAATLSSAGGELLQLLPRGGGGGPGAPPLGFDAVICDEVAQALEPSTLIALQLLAPHGRLVLVGDPQQLPATLLSRAAAAAALAQSLFERLMQAGYPVVLLQQQYRMHPAISAFPASFFYGGKLLDAPAVLPDAPGGGAASGRSAPWHARAALPPLAFWDCREGREAGGGGGGSVSNAEEAEVAYALYEGLAARYQGDLGDVAVLTPYRAQLALLRRVFAARGGPAAAAAGVQFGTVDGFQGREADVVIFSCVRARPAGSGGGVGFLSDVRRMNVALTRARRSLWLVGHAATLEGSEPWQELMRHCRRQRCLFVAAPPYERLTEERGGGGGGRARARSPERRRRR